MTFDVPVSSESSATQGREQIWLNAGNSENPALLLAACDQLQRAGCGQSAGKAASKSRNPHRPYAGLALARRYGRIPAATQGATGNRNQRALYKIVGLYPVCAQVT